MLNNKKHHDVFEYISQYWSEEINNENYFKERQLPFERGSKEYFDYILQKKVKYDYYFDRILTYFKQEKTSQKQLKLLEIGCGMGIDLFRLQVLHYQCYGIDLANKHIELAKKLFQIYNHNVILQKGNAEQLDFPDEYFDYVFSSGVIHHTVTPQKAIDEMYRVMKPGGKGFVMLYAKYSLNNFIHILLKIPFENPHGTNKIAKDAPFVYRYSRVEIKKMFRTFRTVKIEKEYLFGAGWGKIYDFTPKPIYRFFSKILGWHLLIFFEK